jgi:hypothetical protein
MAMTKENFKPHGKAMTNGKLKHDEWQWQKYNFTLIYSITHQMENVADEQLPLQNYFG